MLTPSGPPSGPQIHRIPQAERCTTMAIVAVFTLLAVVSIATLVMSADDQRDATDPRDNPLLWEMFGER